MIGYANAKIKGYRRRIKMDGSFWGALLGKMDGSFFGALLGSLVTGWTAVYIMRSQMNKEDEKDKSVYRKYYTQIDEWLTLTEKQMKTIIDKLDYTTPIDSFEKKYLLLNFQGLNKALNNIPVDYIPEEIYKDYHELKEQTGLIQLFIEMYSEDPIKMGIYLKIEFAMSIKKIKTAIGNIQKFNNDNK